MKYYIPKFNLEKLIKLVNRLSKKTEVKFNYDENDIKLARVLVADGVYATYEEIGVEIDIDYKVGDYKIVAELEHTEGGNILRSFDENENIPKKYRDCKPYCEHCKTLRYRKNTFLLVDKSGDYKQVGSNCLNDYTGYDSDKIAEMCSSLMKLLKLSAEEDEEFMEYMVSLDWDITKGLANRFYQLLINEGYDREAPFMNIKNYSYNKDYDDEVKKLFDVINTDWYDDNSDYCHNVKMVLQMETVENKHWRLLISYLWSAMKYLDDKDINNMWLGNIGDRITFKIKKVKVLWADYNRWASTWRNEVYDYTYRIITEDRAIIIWKTDKSLKSDMIIKATIKSLDTYKDEKQTVVTRGSVISE